LVCRSIKNGQPVWTTPITAVSNRRVYAAISGDKLALSTAMDDVLVLDAKKGQLAWKASPGWLDETLVATEDFALFSNSDGLKCYAISDGREIWTYSAYPDLPSPQADQAVKVKEEVWKTENARPYAADGEHLYVYQWRVSPQREMTGYDIACLNLKDKKLLWTHSISKDFSGFSLAGQKGVVVEGNTLRAIGLQDGKTLWEFPVEGEGKLRGEALVTGGKILVVGSKGLYCIETGDPALTGWPQCSGSALRTGAGEVQ
jgi:outer membrane protein assembly factor BamB